VRITWIQPEDLIRHELWQSCAEGRDTESISSRWRAAGGTTEIPHAGASPLSETSPSLRTLAEELLHELDALPDPTAKDEPSDWADIHTLIAATPSSGHRPHDYSERLNSAWLGRAIGCVLGKPVEKIPRIGIEAILRSAGRWPLDRWITAVGVDPAVTERWPWNRASRTTSLEENINGTPEDDDINYTIMALRVLENHGLSFTSDDVASGWLLDLPAGRSFTAERLAYRNLLQGLNPPATARVRNPFREWIGAQIRTDLYGWVMPGNPRGAAELAWRDAAVSHTRNGLYGAMFVAAMASEAITGSSIERVLDAGESVVPPTSRMARAISFGRHLAAHTTEPSDAFAEIEREFAGYHWVHALNNTALVAYALSAGAGDFDRSICLTVMGGLDTDSNGATVGSVVGALVGEQGISPRWSKPLNGCVSTSLPGEHGVTFTCLAERTEAVFSTQ